MRGAVRFGGVALTAAVCLQAAAAQSPVRPPASNDRPAQRANAAIAPSRDIFDKFCIGCHNERSKARYANLALDGVDLANIGTHAETIEKVVRKLQMGQMPPEGLPRPEPAALAAFVESLERAVDRAAAAAPNPGRVASHRLNRAEYVNAIYDLLALRVDGAELLPSDMAGFGFDNNAEVLSITPALMSRYMAAATKISRMAIASPDNRPITQMYKVAFERRDQRGGEDLPFATRGGIAVRHAFPLDGEYVFTLRLKRNGTVSTIDGIEEDSHEIELRIDHALVKRFTVGGKFKGPDPGVLIAVPEDDLEGQKLHDYRMNADKELEIRVPVKAGTRLVSAAFVDAAPAPPMNVARQGLTRDGQLPGVDMVYISGPFDGRPAGDTPTRQRIYTCRPASAAERRIDAPRAQRAGQTAAPPRVENDEEACARKIIASLARRAYRRPVTDADTQPLLAIFSEGRKARDFDLGLERALEALLSSPKFLIRVELEPAGVKPGAAYRLTDLELASRLSFFLWKSIPDDELLDTAARGQLKDPATLALQVRRMLADRKATRFMSDFVGQWLEVRNIHSQNPDVQLFPSFDDSLRRAMMRETELFFESEIRADRPVQDLLRADYTFLNEQLARHYGIGNVYGSHFRRVALADETRHGLLGHASVLMTTSYADRTSVVLRGKWILENVLGAPPPPPPPNVPPLKDNDRAKPTSLRARMEQHRNNVVCASCHARMDPLGFAMEHFDAVGGWRDNDLGAEINSAIVLSGRTIDSPKAFREALLTEGNGAFVRTAAEKLMTYALGRGVAYYDAPVVRQLVRDVARDDHRWSSLIFGITKSMPFQMRRASGAGEATITSGAQQ